MMKTQGILIVISGFSGVGKGTIIKELLKKWPEEYGLSISATTRKPREGEEDGREYFFLSREEFEKLIAEDKLIEYNEYNGNYYGTLTDYVDGILKTGRNVILEIDYHGGLNVRKKFPQAYLIYVVPAHADQLPERLHKRGTETEEEILERLKQAVIETECLTSYDRVSVNDNLGLCVSEIHSAIISEQNRQSAIRGYREEFCNRLNAIIKGE